MASAVYSDPPASRLSIALEGSASASPFPSPSSSFLPPPTPGAHEFAVKIPPSRNGRKASTPNAFGSFLKRESSETSTSSTSSSASVDAATATSGDGRSSPDPQHNKLQDNNNSPLANTPDTVSSTNGSLPHETTSRPRLSRNSGGRVDGYGSFEPPADISPRSSVHVTTSNPLSANTQPNTSMSTSGLWETPSISPSTPTPYSSVFRAPIPTAAADNSGSGISSSLAVPYSSSLTPLPSPLSSSTIFSSSSAAATPTQPTTKLPSSPLRAESGENHSISPLQSPEIITFDPLQIDPTHTNTADTIGNRASSSANHRPTISTSSIPSATSAPSACAPPSATTPVIASSRPAPPSPAMSRRVSKAFSTASSTASGNGTGTRSTNISRASSLRRKSAGPKMDVNRQSIGSQLGVVLDDLVNQTQMNGTDPSISGETSTSAVSRPLSQVQPPLSAIFVSSSPTNASDPVLAQALPRVYIKIKDYGYPEEDERHVGQGEDVPKPNRVGRMNRRLGPRPDSMASMESSDGGEEEETDDLGGGWGWSSWGSQAGGMGAWARFGAGAGAGAWPGTGNAAAALDREKEILAEAAKLGPSNGTGNGFPTRSDLDMNFLGSGSEDYDNDELDDESSEAFYDAQSRLHSEYEDSPEDDQAGGGDEEDPLYPGLYRALYAFEPEGTAEMRLEEDQIIRVIGRGGGVGWAVVIDERATVDQRGVSGVWHAGVKHALVPESYLEPVKLDWEIEGEGEDSEGSDHA